MSILYRNYNRTQDGKEYGCCERCGREMSEHDFMHTQGNHCVECWTIVLDEVEDLPKKELYNNQPGGIYPN